MIIILLKAKALNSFCLFGFYGTTTGYRSYDSKTGKMTSGVTNLKATPWVKTMSAAGELRDAQTAVIIHLLGSRMDKQWLQFISINNKRQTCRHKGS
jgi:hypothetical protein